MLRTVKFIIAFVLGINMAYGQDTMSKQHLEKMNNARMFCATPMLRNAAYGAKTTQLKQRLIGETTEYHTALFKDSVSYQYANLYRGSVFNFLLMSYVVDFPKFGYEYRASDFLFGNYQPSVFCDKATKYSYNYYSNPYTMDSVSFTMQFDARQNIASHIHEVYAHGTSTIGYARKNELLYDNMDKVVQRNDYYFSQPDYRQYFIYDNQGRLISDSTIDSYSGKDSYKSSYHYDASGKLDILTTLYFNSMYNVWKYSNRFFFSYDINGNINKIITQIGNPLWDNTIDTFSCDANTGYVTYWATYRIEGPGWQSLEKEIIKHINSAFLPDTVIEFTKGMGSDTSIREKKTVFTYNTYGNPETATLFFRDSSGAWLPIPYSTLHYFYEEYQDLSNTRENVPENRLDIYPNPASTHFSISAERTESIQSVEVINAQGQLFKTIIHADNPISVSEWNSGIYFIKICFKDGACTVKKLAVDK